MNTLTLSDAEAAVLRLALMSYAQVHSKTWNPAIRERIESCNRLYERVLTECTAPWSGGVHLPVQ